jgi:hypothetical protein
MMLLICPTAQAREDAADWHDGQIAHGAHARSARRVDLSEMVFARELVIP